MLDLRGKQLVANLHGAEGSKMSIKHVGKMTSFKEVTIRLENSIPP